MYIRFFNTYDTSAPFFRDLIPFLVDTGNQVEMVFSKAKYRNGDDFEIATDHLKKFRAIRTMNFGMQPQNTISKLIVMTTYLIHSIVYSLFGSNVDKNVFLTQPPLFMLWGYVLSIIRQQPYYCVVMDIYPEMAVELGIIRRNTSWTRFLTSLSRFALQKADGVIVIGRCMSDYVEKIGVLSERIYFIPNWADEQLIRPVKHKNNRFRNKQLWKDKFIVLYAGNIGIPQYFDDILEVARQLKNDGNEEIFFVFIGGGSRHMQVKDQVEQNKLTNVELLPFLHEVHPLSEILSAGDLHFVSLKEKITGLAVPSKSYSTLAAGRPIIYQGSERGEIARMILEEGIGTVNKIGDVFGLKNSIIKYYNQSNLLKVQGDKARQLIEHKYSRTYALKKYATLFMEKKIGDNISL